MNNGSNTQASNTDNTPDVNHEDNLNESTDNVKCLKNFVLDNPDLVNETDDEEFDTWEALNICTDKRVWVLDKNKFPLLHFGQSLAQDLLYFTLIWN